MPIQKQNTKRTISICVFFILCIRILWLIFSYIPLFTKPYTHSVFQKAFFQSQWQQSQNVAPDKILDEWAIKQGYTGWQNYIDSEGTKVNIDEKKKNILTATQKKGISDAVLYTYAGYEYIHGKNPILLNPEHPPLGKYLIGISILLFHNEYIIFLIFGLVCLFLIFHISLLLWKFHLIALLITTLFSFHSLFADQLIHGPQLELFQAVFFLAFLYFFYVYFQKKRYIFLFISAINYGCMLSTKTFPTFFLFFGLWFVLSQILFKQRVKQMIMQIATIQGIGLFIFTLTYGVYFAQGGTVRSFLADQKYIVSFYQNSGIPILSFIGNSIPLMLTGFWKFWSTNSYTFYNGWNSMWPILFCASFGAHILFVKQGLFKKQGMPFFLFSFSVSYFLFCIITPIFPRYLFLLYAVFSINLGILFKNIL